MSDKIMNPLIPREIKRSDVGRLGYLFGEVEDIVKLIERETRQKLVEEIDTFISSLKRVVQMLS